MTSSVRVVWLKRDLRLRDHIPMSWAAERGPVVVLWVDEPGLWSQPEMARCHYDFIDDSLRELDRGLRAIGGRLTFRTGRIVDVLEQLHGDLADVGGLHELLSHQETGLLWTYQRDKAVARWCKARGIPWHEVGQDGVQRPHPRRDGWAGAWDRTMRSALTPAPERVTDVATVIPEWSHGARPTPQDLGLGESPQWRQEAGSNAGEALLNTFLRERAADYPQSMSSPNRAWEGCSRLSPHLAWGTVPMRFVLQKTERAQSRARHRGEAQRLAGLEAYSARLHWRGHFMQKLEDEPALQVRSAVAEADGLRASNAERLAAWKAGRTGFPLVDACLRSVDAQCWLTFRMRALVISVASYDLWLPWQDTAPWLAARFLDFEPGIHFPQVQMQSGVTGINQLRIYNPTKQAQEQDPEGTFIRRWVPELRDVPDNVVHTPWLAAPSLRPDYPDPPVNHSQAARRARHALESLRRTADGRAAARDVHQRHGSRLPKGRRRNR